MRLYYASDIHGSRKCWLKFLATPKYYGADVIIIGGDINDEFIVDEALAKAETIEVHDGRVVELGDGFQMIGVGYANITPWNCPRDITEDELAEKIEALAAKIARMDRAVFDIHVPPYDTGIDEAPELTEDKQVVSD